MVGIPGVESHHGTPHVQPGSGKGQQQNSAAHEHFGKGPGSQAGSGISSGVGVEREIRAMNLKIKFWLIIYSLQDSDCMVCLQLHIRHLVHP